MIDRDTPIAPRWANIFSYQNHRLNRRRLIGFIATIVVISYSLLLSATSQPTMTEAVRDRLATRRVSAGKR